MSKLSDTIMLPPRIVRFASVLALSTMMSSSNTRAQVVPEVPAGFMLVDDMILPTDVMQSRAVYDTNFWPQVIAYEYHSNVTLANQAKARTAMDTIESVANLKFIERTNEQVYFRFLSSTGNSSFVGLVRPGQEVRIVSWNFHFIIVHELLHLLGMFHEHQRSDRNQFVQINGANIQTAFVSGFRVLAFQPIFGPYDFDSLTHYSDCAFSVCCPTNATCNCPSSCRTIIARPQFSQWQDIIGQRDHLSVGDIAWLEFAYGPADCNSNSVPDACDISSGQSLDLNMNGIPDECEACMGDANGDGVVNFDDIAEILVNWLSDFTPGSGPGDANSNGMVDFDDITSVLSNWLNVCA